VTIRKVARKSERPNEQPHYPRRNAQLPAPVELWTREAVLEFFGGGRSLHISTLYRGVSAGRYPKPIRVSGNNVRWLADECRAALDRMIKARDEPSKLSVEADRAPTGHCKALS
jgi:predicted DNA-binding transcriptional regulator AlpA